MKENKTNIIRIVVGTLIPIIYTIIHIPPEVTLSQIISAVVVFYVMNLFLGEKNGKEIGKMFYIVVKDVKKIS